ncbi:Hypothetical predicted protein [Paramuricea clavata]|uniref:Uncharacterized protein n=1 Tax=Paramuricea clavata TaxID=317549 RepID=A0A7D9DC81_PARCT|nr:Hypothetical predicted protein [Paramuricea clavata]
MDDNVCCWQTYTMCNFPGGYLGQMCNITRDILIITEHAIYKISCYQDDMPRGAIQDEIPLFLIKLQQYTKDSSYDHEAMNLKKMYKTTKTMMMKLDASDEMKGLNVMVSSRYL